MHARLIAVNGIANVIIPIRDDNVSIAVAIATWQEYGYAIVYLLVEFLIMIGIVTFLKCKKRKVMRKVTRYISSFSP